MQKKTCRGWVGGLKRKRLLSVGGEEMLVFGLVPTEQVRMERETSRSISYKNLLECKHSKGQ